MSWPQYLRRECAADGRTVHLSPAEFRLVVAMLLADPRRFLEQTELVVELWPNGDTQPLAPKVALAIIIHRLRRLGVPIESRANRGCAHQGYRISPSDRGRPSSERLAA